MRITGALCVWNELPEDLDQCVRGIANIADSIVALDGAYARYPTATPHSKPDQLAAIRDAAKATGMDCLIVQPDRLWAGQVEKRSHLLAMASVNSDWFVTVDADHVIHADFDETRLILRHVQADVMSVPYVTPENPDRSLDKSAVGDWHREQMGAPQFIPHIWRSLPGYRVEKFHWWYSAVKNGARHWMWGGDGKYPAVDSQRIRKNYIVEHRTMLRTDEQIRLSRAFLNDRAEVVAQTGQEDDLPTLSPPIYDYDSAPVG